MTTNIKEEPDLYFEFTDNHFKYNHDLMKTSSYLSNKWTTTHVYRLPPFEAGAYLVYNLHKTPHYQLPQSERSSFNKKAKDKNIKVTTLLDHTIEIPDYIYHYSKESPIFQQYIEPKKEQFQINKVLELIKKGKNDLKRGNTAQSFGWHTMNYGEFNNFMTTPGSSEVNDTQNEVLKTLTEVYLSMFQKKIDKVPFTTNSTRTKEFANILAFQGKKIEDTDTDKIMNIFESVTYAVTFCGPDQQLLKNHVDRLNCPNDGFNAVFAVYFTVPYDEKGKMVRLVYVGYSRKSISDYYARLDKRNLFKKHLKKYSQMLDTRKIFNLQSAIPVPNVDGSPRQLSQTLPYIDKCGFYSIFVSPIYDLINSSQIKKKWTLSDIIELVLPIGWLITGTNFYKVLKNWEKNGIPSGNLTIAVINGLIEMGGSLTSGPGSRLQPYCNSNLSDKVIFDGLWRLKHAIAKANNANKTIIEEIMEDICKIYYVGAIGAQHIIAALTLLRVLKDTNYIRKTKVLKGTGTERRIKTLYNLNYSTTNVLFEEISEELFSGCTRLVENMACEFFRDIKKPFETWDESTYTQSIQQRIKGKIRHPDSFYDDQAIFVERDHEVIRESYQASSRQINIQKIELKQYKDNSPDNCWYINENNHSCLYVCTGALQRIKKKKKKDMKHIIYKTVKISWREQLDKVSTNSAVIVVNATKQKQSSSKEEQDKEEVLCYGKTQRDIVNLFESSNDDRKQPYLLFTENWYNNYCAIVRFDIKDVIRDLVEAKNSTTTTKKRKITNPFSMEQDKDADTGKFLHTAIIRYKQSIFLSSTSKSIFMKGFTKYVTKKNLWFNKPLAFYNNKQDAQKATAIETMVHYKRSILNASVISEGVKNINKSMPIALFQNVHGEEPIFFGMLETSKENDKPALYVPIDEECDIYVPWQRFEF